MAFVFCITLLIPVFASSAAGPRRRNAAAFASFKKLAELILNPGFAVTDPKEAANGRMFEGLPFRGRGQERRFADLPMRFLVIRMQLKLI
jgi:hypothetical protein